MKIHKTIHAYIGHIWFQFVWVGWFWREGNGRENDIFEFLFGGEKVRENWWGTSIFSMCPPKYNLLKRKWERKGEKKSHMFLTNKTFLFFPLLSISSFIFCLFLLLLNHFSALSFVCSYPFFSHLFFFFFFFFLHLFLFLICFALLCVCEVSIHTQLNWTNFIIYIFYHISHFSFQLNKWVLYSFNFLAPNQMKP